jgi:predicted metal-dependent hydrolase
MILGTRADTDGHKKQALLDNWYRDQLRQAAQTLVAKWEPRMGVRVGRLFLQKMKTKWGSCNPGTKSIRLNVELAKKPPECLEYIIVHEMAHLIVRRHNDQFFNIMGGYLPGWRVIRQTLNEAPLAHVDWSY